MGYGYYSSNDASAYTSATYGVKNTSSLNLSILDVGCGYGFIGIVLSKVLESKVPLVTLELK